MNGTIGEIRLFAGNFAPRNWAFCDGQLLSIASNTALFSIIGTIYGGDGRTTMQLPDLQGRMAMGSGHAPGLSNVSQGQKGGAENTAVTLANLPAHTHTSSSEVAGTLKAYNKNGDSADPGGNYLAKAPGSGSHQNNYLGEARWTGDFMAPIATTENSGSTGGSQPMTNIQPTLALRFIICTLGTYPSRS